MIRMRCAACVVVLLGGCPRASGSVATETQGRAAREAAAIDLAPTEAGERAELLCQAFPAVAWSGLPEGVEPPSLTDHACLPAGSGAWTFEVEVGTYEPPDDSIDPPLDARFVGTAALVWGTLESGRAVDRARLSSLTRVEIGGADGAFTRLEPFVHDFDGDGDRELVVRIVSGFHEGGGAESRILGFDGTGIADYGPAAVFADFVIRVEDVDADGRLDIWSGRPFIRGRDYTDDGGRMYAGGPPTLWHSLPSGSFTFLDEVGRNALRPGCEGVGSSLYAGLYENENDPQDLGFQRVACALIGGRTLDDVRAELRRDPPLDACLRLGDTRAQCSDFVDGLVEHAERCAAALRP